MGNDISTLRNQPAPRSAEGRAPGGGGWHRWLLAAGVGTLAVAGLRRASRYLAIEPSLRTLALLPPLTYSPLTTLIIRRLQSISPTPEIAPSIRSTERWVPPQGDIPAVRLVILERAASTGPRPALLWLHGGGHVVGTPEQDIGLLSRMLEQLDVLVVGVDYRLAPEHPFPAALDDACAAFDWIAAHADELRVDPNRIAVGGASAGGGLAAATVQRVVDAGGARPAFQLLMYPMLDALTAERKTPDGVGIFVWTPRSNRFGWRSYLGRHAPGGTPAYAVPAWQSDLTAMPATWIGVGTLDLFHGEDVEYGRRLAAAGVDCEVVVVDRAYHAFDLFAPDAPPTRTFLAGMFQSLGRGLGLRSTMTPA